MEIEKSSAESVAYFDELAAKESANESDIERRKLFGYPACFIHGNLFIALHGNRFVLRLGKAEREAFLALPGATAFEPMPGRPMKEYVVAPPEVLAERRLISSWIARSARYARSLPAKVKAPKAPKRQRRPDK